MYINIGSRTYKFQEYNFFGVEIIYNTRIDVQERSQARAREMKIRPLKIARFNSGARM